MIRFIIQTELEGIYEDHIYIVGNKVCFQCVLSTKEYCTSRHVDRLKRICAYIW